MVVVGGSNPKVKNVVPYHAEITNLLHEKNVYIFVYFLNLFDCKVFLLFNYFFN